MKLSKNQLQIIQQTLLDSGIKYQDFFDEIYDHYVVAIEAQMTAGISFEQALEEVEISFKNYSYTSQTRTWYGEEITYWGVEALQYEYAETINIKMFKYHWQIIKSYFKFPSIIVTMIIAGLSYFVIYLSTRQYLILLIALICFLPLLLIGKSYTSSWLKLKLKKQKCLHIARIKYCQDIGLLLLGTFNVIIFSKNVIGHNIFLDTSNIVFAIIFFIYSIAGISFLQLYREQFKMKWA